MSDGVEPTLEDAAEDIIELLRNGNLTDAIDLLMNDGDVRVRSVLLGMEVLQRLSFQRIESSEVTKSYLFRIIDVWETQ